MYCVYLTIYRGVLLPRWYIGMSSVAKVNKGYRGSVSSKKYKQLWKSELRNNPDLFETVILWTTDFKEDALQYEHELQVRLDVVRRDDFINLANSGGFGGIDKDCITKANKGKRVVLLKDSMTYTKINCEDYDKSIHATPKHSAEVREVIAKNTSVSMSKKVKDKSHWFFSDSFRQASIKRRKGVPRTPEVKEAITSGRVDAFSRQWEIFAYKDYPWPKICKFVEWYDANRVKHSKIFAQKAKDFIAELGIIDPCVVKWLVRSVSRDQSRERLIKVCKNFKEQHENKEN